MENYDAYKIYSDFTKFISGIEKKPESEQIEQIKKYISGRSGNEKKDLVQLFVGYLKTKSSFKRKSDKVVLNTFTESTSKNIVFAFGRMNPPTIGHQKLIDAILKEAKKQNAEPRLYLSQTVDSNKNPLSPKDKARYITSVYKQLHVYIDAKNAFNVMEKLSDEGNIGHVVILTGEDRVSEYKKIDKYVKSGEYKVDSVEVKSVGKRNNSSSIEGMSASKVRELIKSDNPFQTIKDALIQGLKDSQIKEIIKKIK